MSLILAKLQDTKSIYKKSILVLYINSEQLNIKIKKKALSITVASRNIKLLGINLSKCKQDLYPKYYRMLLRRIKAGLNK